MRPIKFRGRRLDNGKWAYGSLLLLNDQAQIVNYDGSPLVDPKTVGQYTGLKDIAGREIYEGDIVDSGMHIGVVKWMQGKCCYQISPGGVFLSKSSRIIDNIHDDPELIK